MIPERAQAILDFWFKETPSEIQYGSKKMKSLIKKLKIIFQKIMNLLVKMNMMIGKIIL